MTIKEYVDMMLLYAYEKGDREEIEKWTKMQDKQEFIAWYKRPCSKCGKEKPLSEFYRDTRKGYFGYTSQCKECIKAKRRREYRNKKSSF